MCKGSGQQITHNLPPGMQFQRGPGNMPQGMPQGMQGNPFAMLQRPEMQQLLAQYWPQMQQRMQNFFQPRPGQNMFGPGFGRAMQALPPPQGDATSPGTPMARGGRLPGYFLGGLFDSEKETNTSYNKNTQQQYANQANAYQSFDPRGAGYSQYALQQGQPGILAGQGYAQPYFSQAGNYFNQSAQTPDVSQFFNPMSDAVIAGMKDIFGQQNSQMRGNLAQQAGGVGADRISVGMGELAKQQGLAAGQTLSQLYQPALVAALQQRGLQQGAGAGFGNLGTAAQAAFLSPWETLARYTAGLTPGLGASQTGQQTQSGQMSGTESGNSRSTTTESQSPWDSMMDIAGFAGSFMSPKKASGGAVPGYAMGGFGRGQIGPNPFDMSVMQGARALGLKPRNPWARFNRMAAMADGGEVGYDDGGEVDPFADRFGEWMRTNKAYGRDVNPAMEAWAPDTDAIPPSAQPTQAAIDGEVLPPVDSPPMVPWRPAPREGEMPNPYAMGPQQPMDRSSIGGFLASRGIISPESAETMGNWGKRLQRAALAGRRQTAAAAAELPLKERGLDLQQTSLDQGMLRLQQMQAQAQRELDERMRHNRATEDLAGGRLEQENWQHLGPSEDGTGAIFHNRKTNETRTVPLQIAGKTKPLPTGLQKDLGEKSSSFHTLSSLESGFQDDYADSTLAKTGDVGNWIARNFNIGNVKAADWWQNYQRYVNGVRHGLFGAALTANEIAQWNKADITPGMKPDRIRENIKHQREIIEGALQRRALSLSKQGYSKEAIEAEMGIKIGAPAAAPPAPAPTEKKTMRTVIQNGWVFQEQPDGSMKPIQKVGQ